MWLCFTWLLSSSMASPEDPCCCLTASSATAALPGGDRPGQRWLPYEKQLCHPRAPLVPPRSYPASSIPAAGEPLPSPALTSPAHRFSPRMEEFPLLPLQQHQPHTCSRDHCSFHWMSTMEPSPAPVPARESLEAAQQGFGAPWHRLWVRSGLVLPQPWL